MDCKTCFTYLLVLGSITQGFCAPSPSKAPVPAPGPVPSYDPKIFCEVSTSTGYCSNKLYPEKRFVPDPPLNANDAKAMLAWRDANPAMQKFNDTPCSWSLTRRSYYSNSLYSSPLVECTKTEDGTEMRVTSIDWEGTYSNNYTDSITSKFNFSGLTELSRLRYFWMQDTNFSGELPKEFAQMKRLSSLYFLNTTFNGSIPTEWFANGSFPQLTTLKLQSNKFSGPLPEKASGALISLDKLSLTESNFTGPLPESWTSFGNLTTLLLQGNQLSGSLPAIWGNSTSFGTLNILNLSRNAFEGTLPPQWGSPRAFSRNVYSSYGSLYSKKKALNLYMQENTGLRGQIPAEWSQSGERIDGMAEILSDNYSGALPTMWVFFQPGTDICGSVPPYVVALRNNNPPNGTIGLAMLSPCSSAPSANATG